MAGSKSSHHMSPVSAEATRLRLTSGFINLVAAQLEPCRILQPGLTRVSALIRTNIICLCAQQSPFSISCLKGCWKQQAELRARSCGVAQEYPRYLDTPTWGCIKIIRAEMQSSCFMRVDFGRLKIWDPRYLRANLRLQVISDSNGLLKECFSFMAKWW